MCRTFLAVVLTASLALAGCKTSSTANPATLAPGYTNSADQTMGQVLEAAHNFYTQLQTDAAAGKFSPSATEKAALNGFAVTLNSAQAEYLAFHAGTATQAQAQAAVNQVSTAQATLQAQLQAK